MKTRTALEWLRAFPTLYDHPDCLDVSPPSGWHDLVWALSEKLEALDVKAAQVKSKFGELRFYLHEVPNYTSIGEVDALIAVAEEKAARTCEKCGEPGEGVLLGKLTATRCAAHRGES